MAERPRGLVGRVLRRLLGAGGVPPAAPRSPAPDAGPPPQRPPSGEGRGVVPAPPAADELPLEVEEPVPGSLLVDVREPGEYATGVAEGALLLPMDLVPHHLDRLPPDRVITVYCAAGARSAGVAHWLREQGFPRAVSLAGGVSAVRYGGIAVRVPPGVVPGTRVRVPGGTVVDGVTLGGDTEGEVIEQVGERLRVRIHDANGYQVEVEVGVG